jgi:thioredoxin
MKTILASEFTTEVVQSTVPVVVDFFTPFCGPCKQLAPILEEIAEEQGDAVKFVKIDASLDATLAASLEIRAVPTIFLFRSGKRVAQFTGFRPKKDLQKWIGEALAA